jgi:hypothetical protein
MSNFMNIKLVGEPTDLPCNPTRSNTVVKTKRNGFKMADRAGWDDWAFCIVFPDEAKAQHFIANFRHGMCDYTDGMAEGDYAVHIIHFKYPKVDTLYADQINVQNRKP